MLEKLLMEIRQGGTMDTSKLAARLNTSPEMVQAMLDHLRRNGFLLAYQPCVEVCDSCGLAQTCNPQEKSARVKLWRYVQDDRED